MSEDYNLEGYEALAVAIVQQAVKDYERALIALQKKPNNDNAQSTVRRCETFFKEDMRRLNTLDGEAIIQKIRDRTKKGEKV